MTSDLFHPFPYCLELEITFRELTAPEVQERIWDALVQWLEHRHAFLGGNAACAFVLIEEYEHRLASKLTQWLQRQPAVGHWQLRLAIWQPLTSTTPEMHNARIDALSNLQQHLVERMARATQAMYFLKWKDLKIPST
jgi:hypothetical protein